MRPAHAAVVLAAGGSVRLGQPKQLLMRHGETLVRRTTRLVLESGASRVLVIGGARVDDIHAAVEDLPVELLVNTEWQEGLASSLRIAACALARHDAPTLIVGCDQPLLAASDLLALLSSAASATSGCAVTRHQDRPGIPVVLSPSVLRTAHSLRGDRGFRDILNALPQDGLAWHDAPGLAHDLDTPANVAHAIAQGWLDPSASGSNA
ncbi:nucleotidyltransferase family protein [Pseudoxanthomonas sp. SL93]|uniref:nucleotidyltransferase family protein n=1 Tax=Pseudoxanthomonas sp. SL93 TaxID=2995142 RepID=UPI00226EF6F9|nr:nucleotidyltransferase family protein [Pseudoxanthomonas sp. SL93]WAC62023.1 nucleotidyltransferase family protein [Pseudoxanthomonas sp. SL93]